MRPPHADLIPPLLQGLTSASPLPEPAKKYLISEKGNSSCSIYVARMSQIRGPGKAHALCIEVPQKQGEPMEDNVISFKDCDKTCPRECEIMNRILLREASIDQLYVQLLKECDYPDVKTFVATLIEHRRASIAKLEGSLNKMYSSYDPAGC